jgi:hypothetical protein
MLSLATHTKRNSSWLLLYIFFSSSKNKKWVLERKAKCRLHIILSNMHSSVHIFLMLNGKIVLAPGHEPDCPQNLYCVQSFAALQYYTCILYHWSLYCTTTISSRYALLYYPCISTILPSSPLFGNIFWREMHFCTINSENCKAELPSKMYNILLCLQYSIY